MKTKLQSLQGSQGRPDFRWDSSKSSFRSKLALNLDDVVPHPQFRLCHSRVIAAPLADIWDELNTVSMSALPLGLVLESLRLLPAKLTGHKHPSLAGRTFLDVTPLAVLFSEPLHGVISAGLSQAWRLLGGSAPPVLDAAGLRDWIGTGWLKVGMESAWKPPPRAICSVPRPAFTRWTQRPCG